MLRFSFFLMLALWIGFNADAAVLNLTYNQFMELPDRQKDQWVIKTMELMVELEGRYRHEVKTSGWSLERFRRYTQVMKKFESLLLDSAHAADSGQEWAKYGQDFARLLSSSNGGTNCIYGGWVSRVVGNYCVHPHFLGKSSQEAKAYAKGSSCEGRNRITCNPAVFGYKSENAKSLFCVKAGLNEAHNSSLNCMREALSDTPEKGKDTKDVRIRNLRSRLMAHPEIFKDVQKFIFETCICEADSEKLSASYHAYMRPHRTCYGMMEMLSSTACEDPKIDFDTTFFEKLRAFTHDKINTSTSGPEIDSIYKSFLKEIKTSAPDEYARICPNDQTGGGDKKHDDDGKGGHKDDGKEDGKDDGKKSITLDEKPDPGPITPDTLTTPVTVDSTPGKVNPGKVVDLAPVTVQGSPVTYICKKATCRPVETKEEAPDAPKYSCDYEIVSVVEGVEEVTPPEKAPVEVPASPDDVSVTINALYGKKSESLTCPVTFHKGAVADDSEKLKDDKGDATKDAGDKPTIVLSLKEKTDTTQKVSAEVTNDEGYTVIWYRKGHKGEKAKPKADDGPIKGLAGDATEPEEEPKEKSHEAELDTIADAEDQLDVEVKRTSDSYQTCAKMTAEGKEPSEESCVTIPALEKKPAPRTLAAPKPQQPPLPPRGATNTSAIGIR